MGGTDILIVNAVETVPVTVTGSATGSISLGEPSGVPAGRIVLAIEDNCSAGELFQHANAATAKSVAMAGVGGGGASFTPGNQPSSNFEESYGANSRIAEFSTKAFYIGMAGGEPALFMRRLGGNNEPAQELVRGVESMQVMYGMSTNKISQADQYVSADAVNDWSEVMSVSFVNCPQYQ